MERSLSKIPSLLVPEKEPVVEKVGQELEKRNIEEALRQYLANDDIEGIKSILDKAYMLLGHDHELVKTALEVLAEKRYTLEEIEAMLQGSRKSTGVGKGGARRRLEMSKYFFCRKIFNLEC